MKKPELLINLGGIIGEGICWDEQTQMLYWIDLLVNPPGRWTAYAALGRVAYALGDDDRAEQASHRAAELVEAFAATLSRERSTRLLNAPATAEILAGVGPSAGAH